MSASVGDCTVLRWSYASASLARAGAIEVGVTLAVPVAARATA
jgi:hypothetical protein